MSKVYNPITRMMDNETAKDSKTKDAYNDFIVKARLDAQKAEKEFMSAAKKHLDNEEKLESLFKEYESKVSKILQLMRQQVRKINDEAQQADFDLIRAMNGITVLNKLGLYKR